VPREKLEAAARRGAEAVQKALREDKKGERSRGEFLEPGALNRSPTQGGKGSVVAFYAAQSFEKAPELPRPSDAPRTSKHYYGMLTYTLTKALQERKSAMTYRELARVLVSAYRAERGSHPPTPYCEGDLDREVLGLTRWPPQDDIVLHKDGATLKVSAGELRGLTAGCVLAVHPPAGDARGRKAIVGYIKVVAATSSDAQVEACSAPGAEAAGSGTPVAGAALPDLARCTIVARDVGDMRVKLARCHFPAGKPESAESRQLAAALDLLSSEVRDLVRIVPAEAEADWVLFVVTPEQARAMGLGGLPRPMALLMQGDGRKVLPADGKAARAMVKPGFSRVPRVAARYAVEDPKRLAGLLERDLQRIFTWQNVWRVAGVATNRGTAGGGKSASEDYGLKFEVLKLKGPRKVADGQLTNGASVIPGQRIRARLANEGPHVLWVTLLVLDGKFGFQVLRPMVLVSGASRDLLQGTITGDTTGTEGFVVLALPTTVNKSQPNFEFLAQPPLGQGSREATRGGEAAAATPFGRLMAGAALGKGQRSFQEEVPTNPAVLSWSWQTLPAAASP
jgi:hypothetical protein